MGLTNGSRVYHATRGKGQVRYVSTTDVLVDFDNGLSSWCEFSSLFDETRQKVAPYPTYKCDCGGGNELTSTHSGWCTLIEKGVVSKTKPEPAKPTSDF